MKRAEHELFATRSLLQRRLYHHCGNPGEDISTFWTRSGYRHMQISDVVEEYIRIVDMDPTLKRTMDYILQDFKEKHGQDLSKPLA